MFPGVGRAGGEWGARETDGRKVPPAESVQRVYLVENREDGELVNGCVNQSLSWRANIGPLSLVVDV